MRTAPGRNTVVLAGALAAALLASSVALVAHAAPPAGRGGGGAPAAPALPPVPQDGPSILETYKSHYLIGTAADVPGNFSEADLALIKKEFNQLTPENGMKPGPMHPSDGTYRFEGADALVKWCVDNNIWIQGHNLAWHSQSTNWMFQNVDKETGLKRFKDHITTIVSRYKGKIKGWDVVNEAIDDDRGANRNDGTTEWLRNSMYTQNIGPDFLTIAFKTAHEADPACELWYNDYNIERSAKHQSSLLLLKRLIADKSGIYGVGIQGHWSTANGGPPYADIDKAISNYKALGLKVAITELDVTIQGQAGGQLGPGLTPDAAPPANGAPPAAGRRGGRGGRGAPPAPDGAAPPAPPAPAAPGAFAPSDVDTFFIAAPAGPAGAPPAAGAAPAGAPPGAAGAPPGAAGAGRGAGRGAGGGGGRGRGAAAAPSAEGLKAQADAYAKLFQIFEKHKDTITRVTFWGLNDQRSWRAGQSPLIFDGQNQRKAAYNAIVDVIKNPNNVPKLELPANP